MPTHADPDDLALRALGEQPDDPADDGHLAACVQCRSELDQLRSVVATARAVEPADYPVEPPARVWEAVAAELGLATTAVDHAARRASDTLDTPDAPAAPTAPEAPDDELAARRTARSRARTAAVAAAAAVVGIALGATGALLLADDGPAERAPVVAAARLSALPERDGTGSARLREDGGRQVLDVKVADLSAVEGFYEVWLLDAQAQRLVSLGLLEGGSGRFQVPAAVDVADYPVVDVSREPADGDPAHSGDSVVRGSLRG